VKLEMLSLKQFRNYENQKIEFGNGINILYGDNAQGKTNVIEAIHLTGTGKSHRSKHLGDMVRHGEDRFSIDACVRNKERDNHVHLTYDRKTGKKMTINDVSSAKWSSLLGMMHVLLFSPETMDIVKGGPGERRRFMDILLCQLDARYLRALQQYTSILRNKTASLRDHNGLDKYRDMIPIWNEGMAHAGAIIALRRMQAAERLQQLANHELSVLSGGRETMTVSLQTFTGKEVMKDYDALRSLLMEKLSRAANREEASGMCLVGIHRDEIHMAINDNAVRTFASQGQQRSIALSLILASMNLYWEESGAMPILLLDDVMSELDPHRQEYLLGTLEKTQTFITTTDRSEFMNRFQGETVYLEVRDGIVLRNE